MRRSDRLALAGLLIALGGGVVAELVPSMFPRHGAVIFYAALSVVLAGVAVLVWALFHRKGVTEVSDNGKRTVVGTDILSEGGGTAVEIECTGTPEQPSIGAESIARADPGETAIGTRIVQNGPGVGLRIVQNGPGVGYRSIATSGAPEKKSD